jgi:hypothetical protein
MFKLTFFNFAIYFIRGKPNLVQFTYTHKSDYGLDDLIITYTWNWLPESLTIWWSYWLLVLTIGKKVTSYGNRHFWIKVKESPSERRKLQMIQDIHES